jgi:hypothetical protein
MLDCEVVLVKVWNSWLKFVTFDKMAD